MFLALVFGPCSFASSESCKLAFIAKKGRRAQEKRLALRRWWSVDRLSTAVPVVLWADLANPFVLIALSPLLVFAGIGFMTITRKFPNNAFLASPPSANSLYRF